MSNRRTELHRAISGELSRFGIVPEVEQIVGGHFRFRWRARDQDQQLFTASIPKDHRAIKNEVAKVRRLLRDVGLIARQTDDRRAAAFDLAALEERIAALESDVRLLLDLLTSPDRQTAPPPSQIDAPAPPPVEALPNPPAAADAPATPPAAKARKRTKAANCWLWRVLRYDDYLPATAIAKAARKSPGTTSVLLTYWKAKGYVQHVPRVGWRKDRKVEQLVNGSLH